VQQAKGVGDLEHGAVPVRRQLLPERHRALFDVDGLLDARQRAHGGHVLLSEPLRDADLSPRRAARPARRRSR
jgi:hypothetical protein